MKIVSMVARYLLGVIFLVFGLNGFLHFIPMPPMTGPAGQFITVLVESNYMAVVSLLQLVGAVLLLINRYVPLALTVLAPVIANVFLFHAFLAPSGLPLAAVVLILWILVASGVWSSFKGVLEHRPAA